MEREVISHRIGTAYVCTGLVRYCAVAYTASGKQHTLSLRRGEILLTKACMRGSVGLVIQVGVTLGNVVGVVGRAWIPVET